MSTDLRSFDLFGPNELPDPIVFRCDPDPGEAGITITGKQTDPGVFVDIDVRLFEDEELTRPIAIVERRVDLGPGDIVVFQYAIEPRKDPFYASIRAVS